MARSLLIVLHNFAHGRARSDSRERGGTQVLDRLWTNDSRTSSTGIRDRLEQRFRALASISVPRN
jgi:hypothetical protein